MTNIRVLVCGGAGYIGSHVSLALTRSDFGVVVLDNLSTGHRGAIDETKVKFVKADVRDESALERVFSETHFDVVVHLCADSLVGESIKNPLKYYENNVGGAISLLKCMHKNGVKRIVFSSTAAIFGTPQNLPILENDPKLPSNPYGETKLAIERLLHWADKSYNIRSVCLRYFNAAGAEFGGNIGELHNPETHLIPNVLKVASQGLRNADHALKIYGSDYDTPDGTCVRDFVHVSDLATAHVLSIKYLLGGGTSSHFNLGCEVGYSVKQVIEMCRRVTGIDIVTERAPRRPGDPPILIASTKKAKEELGWVAVYSLEDMVRSAWLFYRQQKANL